MEDVGEAGSMKRPRTATLVLSIVGIGLAMLIGVAGYRITVTTNRTQDFARLLVDELKSGDAANLVCPAARDGVRSQVINLDENWTILRAASSSLRGGRGSVRLESSKEVAIFEVVTDGDGTPCIERVRVQR